MFFVKFNRKLKPTEKELLMTIADDIAAIKAAVATPVAPVVDFAPVLTAVAGVETSVTAVAADVTAIKADLTLTQLPAA